MIIHVSQIGKNGRKLEVFDHQPCIWCPDISSNISKLLFFPTARLTLNLDDREPETGNLLKSALPQIERPWGTLSVLHRSSQK